MKTRRVINSMTITPKESLLPLVKLNRGIIRIWATLSLSKISWATLMKSRDTLGVNKLISKLDKESKGRETSGVIGNKTNSKQALVTVTSLILDRETVEEGNNEAINSIFSSNKFKAILKARQSKLLPHLLAKWLRIK